MISLEHKPFHFLYKMIKPVASPKQRNLSKTGKTKRQHLEGIKNKNKKKTVVRGATLWTVRVLTRMKGRRAPRIR